MDNVRSLVFEVIDQNGNMRACGREKCKELIRILKDLYPNVDFGNPETGFVNQKMLYQYFVKNEVL
jgi:hypothetical protein